MTVHVYDRLDLPSQTKRKKTPEGFLYAPGVLARTGVQEYAARELGIDEDRIIRLFRPPEEVYDYDSLKSFEDVTVTLGHPLNGGHVSADNWRGLSVGDVKNIGASNGCMTGDLIIRHADAIRSVENGTAQLSNGYSFDLDLTPGNTDDGQPYDGVQRNIRGNHLAIVDVARGGSVCRIADSQPTKEIANMEKKVSVTDEVAKEIEKLKEELKQEKANSQQKAHDADETKKLVEEMKKQIEDLKTKTIGSDSYNKQLTESLKLRTEAKRLLPSVTIDGRSDADIQKEVLQAIAKTDQRVGDSLKTYGEDYASAFKALAALYQPSSAATSQLGSALLGSTHPVVSTKLVGRDRFIARTLGQEEI